MAARLFCSLAIDWRPKLRCQTLISPFPACFSRWASGALLFRPALHFVLSHAAADKTSSPSTQLNMLLSWRRVFCEWNWIICNCQSKMKTNEMAKRVFQLNESEFDIKRQPPFQHRSTVNYGKISLRTFLVHRYINAYLHYFATSAVPSSSIFTAFLCPVPFHYSSISNKSQWLPSSPFMRSLRGLPPLHALAQHHRRPREESLLPSSLSSSERLQMIVRQSLNLTRRSANF